MMLRKISQSQKSNTVQFYLHKMPRIINFMETKENVGSKRWEAKAGTFSMNEKISLLPSKF